MRATQRPMISICALVHLPPGRVEAVLDPFRELDCEIVLAVDDRQSARWLAGYRRIADRVLVVEFPGSFGYLYSWLVSQCRGRWVFHVEDDEIPSTSLTAEVASLLERDDLTHAWVARRWLWPDRRHYLTQWPWRTDFQPRLLRRDPAVMRVPGRIHAVSPSAGQGRILRAPLWHTHLLLRPYEQRVSESSARERLEPGAATMGGRSVNETYYLPERAGEPLDTTELPGEEAARVEQYFAAGERVPRRRGRKAPVREFSAAQVSSMVRAGQLSDSAYRAQLRHLHREPIDAPVGDTLQIEIEVSNLGTEPWPAGAHADPLIRLGAKWLSEEGQPSQECPRNLFRAPIAPGESAVEIISVPAPDEPGRHRLSVDLVHENVRWFGTPIVIEVDVGAEWKAG